VYRTAFVPALVAVFIAAFSLTDRPAPATSPLAADAFDSGAAFGDDAKPQRNSLNELARTFPSRTPGSAGDDGLADRVGLTFRAPGRHGVKSPYQVSRSSTDVDGKVLETVVGVRPGVSNRRVVVIAGRDAVGSPGRAELSATATLLELSRVFRQRELRKDARARLDLGQYARVRGRARVGEVRGRRADRRPCSCSATWPGSGSASPGSCRGGATRGRRR